MARKKFSLLEIKHLVVSVLVMSFAIAYSRSFVETLYMMPFALIIIAPAFVFHELGHKFAAQHYGYWAEYRMWAQGLLFAIFLAVATTYMGSKFLFIAPGAVYFSSRMHFSSLEKIGRIGISGPIVNLCLFVVFAFIAVVANSELISWIGFTGAYVNAFLAIFNLIPFPPLDGQKIFVWNKKIWGFAFAIAIAAFVFIYSAI